MEIRIHGNHGSVDSVFNRRRTRSPDREALVEIAGKRAPIAASFSSKLYLQRLAPTPSCEINAASSSDAVNVCM